MAYTQNDIDALKAAIATGALEVEFGAGPDRRKVRYRSLNEMLQTLSIMQETGTDAGPQISFVQHRRD